MASWLDQERSELVQVLLMQYALDHQNTQSIWSMKLLRKISDLVSYVCQHIRKQVWEMRG